MKKLLKKIFIIVIFFIIAAGICLFISAKFTGTNYFENIKNSLLSGFNQSKTTHTAVQNSPLEIINNTISISTLQNTVAFTIKSNHPITIDQSDKSKLFLAQSPNADSTDYWYVIAVYNLGIGAYTYNVAVKDEFNQTQQ